MKSFSAERNFLRSGALLYYQTLKALSNRLKFVFAIDGFD